MCQLLRCTSSLMMVLGAWTKYHNDNWYQNWWFDKTSIEMTEWNGGELLLYPFASWFTIHTWFFVHWNHQRSSFSCRTWLGFFETISMSNCSWKGAMETCDPWSTSWVTCRGDVLLLMAEEHKLSFLEQVGDVPKWSLVLYIPCDTKMNVYLMTNWLVYLW